MRICDIRPIPKRILAIVRQADEQNFPQPDGHVRFYSYLTTARRELIKVTVAVKHIRKRWFCKQVAIHGLYSSKCYVKDMEYCGYFGMASASAGTTKACKNTETGTSAVGVGRPTNTTTRPVRH